MVQTTQKLATYADIEALPPHVTGQIIDGELYVSPRSAKPHARTASLLGGFLSTALDFSRPGDDGWFIYHELELHLGSSVLVPDIAGWVRPRMDTQPTQGCETAPDWICEILSPSTERLDRAKLFAYARHGVRHAWLVHPVNRSVEIFELRDGAWSLLNMHIDDEMLSAPPFTDLQIPLNRIWLEPFVPDADDDADA